MRFKQAHEIGSIRDSGYQPCTTVAALRLHNKTKMQPHANHAGLPRAVAERLSSSPKLRRALRPEDRLDLRAALEVRSDGKNCDVPSTFVMYDMLMQRHSTPCYRLPADLRTLLISRVDPYTKVLQVPQTKHARLGHNKMRRDGSAEKSTVTEDRPARRRNLDSSKWRS